MLAAMGDAAKKVYEQALALPASERADLVERLAASLDADGADDGYAEAWTEELSRRVAELEAGRAQVLSDEAVVPIVRRPRDAREAEHDGSAMVARCTRWRETRHDDGNAEALRGVDRSARKRALPPRHQGRSPAG